MDEILREFIDDLNAIYDLIVLFDLIKASSVVDFNSSYDETHYLPIKTLHEQSKKCKFSLPVLPGTIILYLGGRFENYVKTIFEELCEEISSNRKSFRNLPRSMRDNLLKLTAEVISDPRKYGHGEKGVESFISNMHNNIINDDVTKVNSCCLSITYENLRPNILSDLFERIGCKNIWQTIGEQGELKVFLKATNTEQSKNLAMKHLNDFMDKRNTIAHPSNAITWPDIDIVKFYLDFLIKLGSSIKCAAQIYYIQIENSTLENGSLAI